MNHETFNKLRLAGAALVLVCTWGLGFRACAARALSHPAPTDRNQIAALAADAIAAGPPADSQARHRIAQKGVSRLIDELADAEKANEALRRELGSLSAGGRGSLSAAGPMQ